MLTVKTYVAPSAIQGLGLFAGEPVAAGALVWRFTPPLDVLVDAGQIDGLGPAFRAFVDRYGYVSPDFPGRFVISCDHAKFMNHSEDPAIESRGLESFARRAIADGEEITCDYRAFVVGFTSFD